MGGTFRDLEKDIWGKSSAPMGGGASAKPPEWSIFSTPLNWLRNALRLQSPNTPTSLDVTNVIPALDVFQGGYPLSTFVGTADTQTGLFAAATMIVVPVNRTITQRLVALEVVHSGAGAVAPIQGMLQLGTFTQTTPFFVRIASVNLAAGAAVPAVATYQDIFGARDVWVPPGFSLQLVWGIVANLETVEFHAGIQQIPAGFKP